MKASGFKGTKGSLKAEIRMMASQPKFLARKRGLLLIAIAVLSVAGALAAGQVATYPNLSVWYAGLTKPWFNPPNALFGPVWTTLFALMAYAVWRILRLSASTLGRSTALLMFYGQLILNAGWSWAFFAAHSPLLGLIDIVPQLFLILAAIAAFYRLDPPAAFCLVPLAIWVSFATALNFAIWRLNG